MIFDINRLSDKISYQSVNGGGGIVAERLKEIAGNEIAVLGSETLKQYFLELIRQNNLWLFEPAHLKTFAEEFEQRALQTDFLEITTAVELSQEDILAMAAQISAKLGRKVVVDVQVNQDLIGGAIIKKDNYILDYSIQTKLLNLSEKWKSSLTKSRTT